MFLRFSALQKVKTTRGFFPLKCTVISPNRKDLKPVILLVIHFLALSNSVSHEIRAGSNFSIILPVWKIHFLFKCIVIGLNLFHHLRWRIPYKQSFLCPNVNGVFAKKFKMILNAQINCVLGQCFTDTEFLIGSNTRSAVILLILLKMLTLWLSYFIKYIFMLHIKEV